MFTAVPVSNSTAKQESPKLCSILDDEDYKKTIDLLSETLKYGEELQNDKSKSEEDKKRIHNEIKNKINESMIKQLELQEELNDTCSEICNLQIKLQNYEDQFNEKLSTLMSLIKSLDDLKVTLKRFNQVEELKSNYLKKITNIILALRDFTLKPIRSNEFKESFANVCLNQSEFDQVLNKTSKEINELHNEIISSVNRLQNDQKVTNFQIFKTSTNPEHDNVQFLFAIEQKAFDYNQFNF